LEKPAGNGKISKFRYETIHSWKLGKAEVTKPVPAVHGIGIHHEKG